MSRPLKRIRAITMAFVLTAGAAVAAVVVTAPPAPADTGAACAATYTIGWQTPSNSPPDFGATITVTNNAAFTIQTWTVSWTFTAGQTIVAGSPYSSTVTQTGTSVTATPGGTYNAVLTPGESQTFGFDGDYNGTSNPVPTVSCVGPSEGTGSAALTGSLDPLGVNTASWDTNFTDPAIASSLSAASTGLLRYPGGSYADGYLWQSNSYQGTTDPVDFAQYSTQADAITNGQKFVTVNYGSDTPADAASWVTQSQTSGEGVSLWEIGNEEYGSWETDDHTNPHTATSYATNGLTYMQAMKAVNPNAQICYDYAMDGNLAPGSGVTNYQQWNDTILSADAADINCADVHWYPINGTPTETTQSIMSLVDNIPAAAAEVHLALSTYDPSAYFVVGETNMSQTANTWNEEPVGALFAAANSMEWLSFGAQSVDWWDVQNYGTPTGDFGMFSSATSGEPAIDTPYPPYYGYLLASKLAIKGATVGTLLVSTPNIYAYYSKQSGGGYSVMLINADPSNAYTIPTSSLGITSTSETEYTYSAANPTVATSSFSGSSVSVPAQSIVVLANGSGTQPTPTPTPTPTTPTPT
ncbi:MAG TPA: cellulose binding domain-containing protein, partial [Trebonia sp.]|nr:cellulose binding domain-containing protein [Trebonia sp.]